MPVDPFARVAGLTRGAAGWVPERDPLPERPPTAPRAVPVRVIVSAVVCGVLVVVLLLGRGALSEAGAVETVPGRATASVRAGASPGTSPGALFGSSFDASLVPVPTGSEPALLGGAGGVVATGQPVPMVVVHVAGRVRRPGLVTLTAGGRLAEAIGAAGGAGPGAAPHRLNLARHVADGEKIVVPGPHDSVSEGPVTGGTVGAAGGSAGGPAAGIGAGGGSGLLDLNTATQPQLEELPGIGPVTASAIIGWRTAHQRFSRVEELGEVDGIGPKTLERLRPLVRV